MTVDFQVIVSRPQRVPSSLRGAADARPPPGRGLELYVPAAPGSISTSATSRAPLLVPHHADIRLLPVIVLKRRLFAFSADDTVTVSSDR